MSFLVPIGCGLVLVFTLVVMIRRLFEAVRGRLIRNKEHPEFVGGYRDNARPPEPPKRFAEDELEATATAIEGDLDVSEAEVEEVWASWNSEYEQTHDEYE